MNHNKAVLTTFFVAFLWSLAGILIKSINLSPLAITGGKCLITFILLTPLVLKIEGKKYDKYVIAGGLFYAAFSYCFNISTKLTVSAVAIVMQYTAPIYVAFFSSYFLKEKITKLDIISMIFVFSGMIMFFLDEFSGGNLVGNVIAVFNGITFAGLAICFRLQKNAHPILSVYCGNLFGGIIGLPFFVSAGIPDAHSLFFLFLFSAQAAITFVLYSKASQYLSALETVLLPILDPLLNPVWVYLMLGEKMGVISILGEIMVLTSITVRVICSIKKERHNTHCPAENT